MDFNVKKIVKDAGAAISRVVQVSRCKNAAESPFIYLEMS